MDYKFNYLFDNYAHIEIMVLDKSSGTHKGQSRFVDYYPNGFDIEYFESRSNIKRINPNELDRHQSYFKVLVNGDVMNPIFYEPIEGGRLMNTVMGFRIREKVKLTHEIKGKNIPFVYVIDTNNSNEFRILRIPDEVLEMVHEGLGVIAMHTACEPFSLIPTKFYNELVSFSKKHKLNRGNFKVLCGDQTPPDLSISDFEFVPYMYFWDFPWFINMNTEITKVRRDIHTEEIQNDFRKFALKNTNPTFERKFLCYQRRAHQHRRLITYELMNDDVLKRDTFLSFWNEERTRYQSYEIYGYTTKETHLINDFFSGFVENLTFDDVDITENQAMTIDLGMHKKTFLSIVSETKVNGEVFFSEKTFKPMYCLQPFIMVNSNGSLKHLRDKGFKTFNDFWDESYDDAPTFKEKIHKIMSIMRDINKMGYNELKQMYVDMEPILVHNFNHLTSFNSFRLGEILEDIQPKIPYKEFNKLI